MFTRSFTEMTDADWAVCPRTTNAVESQNKGGCSKTKSFHDVVSNFNIEDKSICFSTFAAREGIQTDAPSATDDENLERTVLIDTYGARGENYGVYENGGEETDAKESSNQISHPGRTRRLVQEYDMEDFVWCLDSLSLKRKRRPIHIAFTGDSTVRQHFISFQRWVPDYDRKIGSQSTVFAQYPFHEDRNLTSQVLDNLIVSFYWRNLIKEDLIADFKRWASTSDHNHAPDFILLGKRYARNYAACCITAHHIVPNNVTKGLQEYETLFVENVLPFVNRSLTLHPQQKIVWLLQNPTMEYAGPSADRKVRVINPEKIVQYNSVIRRIFNFSIYRGTRVVIWDAVGVLVEEYLRACFLSKFHRKDKSWYANCQDFIHPGYRALSISTQHIINHICNEY
ncbi:Uncharacterized protein APZ42_033030 [Daphnia magna]|uniref:Uncharacterized protein n=1 Tax=Daphnia magna TaxID=35525 RepID=A0A164LGZ9_9CRUS|nr:Uncharacterized protein APZ42_033030 [Daphnia magna]